MLTGRLNLRLENGETDYAAMKRYGYSYVDFQDFLITENDYYKMGESEFENAVKAEKEKMDSAGIGVYQAHAPWPTDDTTKESRLKKLEYMKRAIKGTSLLGGKYLVVHPVMPFGWDGEDDPKLAYSLSKELFNFLCDYAKPYGVSICIENMPMKNHNLSRIPKIIEFVDDLNRDNLFICLDTGHCNVFSDSCGEMVRLCGKRLKVLHVHDNFADRDYHYMPFHGTIDWEDFKKALKEINFEGVLSLETEIAEKYPEEIMNEARFIEEKVAEYLANNI